MRTLRLYVGENFKAVEFVEHLLGLDTIDGATILEAKGYWRAPRGKIVSEPAHVIVLALNQFGPIIRAAVYWANAQGEESVMVERPDGTVDFYFTTHSI